MQGTYYNTICGALVPKQKASQSVTGYRLKDKLVIQTCCFFAELCGFFALFAVSVVDL